MEELRCLSRSPEIYGAEQRLAHRAASPAVVEKLPGGIEWWRAYTTRNGDERNNDPSHGNNTGGLTAIREKSLGAVAKGGGPTPLNAVYECAEPVEAAGLVFIDTPGYDPMSLTGQVAGGCNNICFTTGPASLQGSSWRRV